MVVEMQLRERILQRIYQQVRKLLGPAPGKTEVPPQWNDEFPGFDFTNTAAEGYPLSDEEIRAFDGARVLQEVHIGSSEVQNLIDSGVLPALFIDIGTNMVMGEPSEQLSQAVEDILPFILRLVLLEPVTTERRPELTNVALSLRIHDAFDYLLDSGEFRQLNAMAVGYRIPYQVFDAALVSASNYQGENSPSEIIDYRFEVRFTRQKERNRR